MKVMKRISICLLVIIMSFLGSIATVAQSNEICIAEPQAEVIEVIPFSSSITREHRREWNNITVIVPRHHFLVVVQGNTVFSGNLPLMGYCRIMGVGGGGRTLALYAGLLFAETFSR